MDYLMKLSKGFLSKVLRPILLMLHSAFVSNVCIFKIKDLESMKREEKLR